MDKMNLQQVIFAIEREIRKLPEESATAERLADAVNLILDVMNGTGSVIVSNKPKQPDGGKGDRLDQLIRKEQKRSADTILDNLAVSRRRKNRPESRVDRFRLRYAGGI